MSEELLVFALGPVTVAVRTSLHAVLDHLMEFYPIADRQNPEATWTIDVSAGTERGAPPDRWGVWHRIDAGEKRLILRSTNIEHLAVSARKCAREVFLNHCEEHGYTMLHASAFTSEDDVVLIVGDKGSGKTTLALRAVLQHGYHYLSNDHLIIYPDDSTGVSGQLSERLVLTSLPTPIPVKVGTYLDLQHVLPKPWARDDLGMAPLPSLPVPDRYRHRGRLLYTFRRLGQDNPVAVRLASSENGPRVTIVLAGYADAACATSSPHPVDDSVSSLWPHVRFDWMFDRSLNQRYLDRSERDQDTYTADATYLIAALSARARVWTWSHHGDPTPLLDAINDGSAP